MEKEESGIERGEKVDLTYKSASKALCWRSIFSAALSASWVADCKSVICCSKFFTWSWAFGRAVQTS